MKRELCRNAPLSPDTMQSVIHKLEIAPTNQGLVRIVNALGPITLIQCFWGSCAALHLPPCRGTGKWAEQCWNLEDKLQALFIVWGVRTRHWTSLKLSYIFHKLGIEPAQFYWAIWDSNELVCIEVPIKLLNSRLYKLSLLFTITIIMVAIFLYFKHKAKN